MGEPTAIQLDCDTPILEAEGQVLNLYVLTVTAQHHAELLGGSSLFLSFSLSLIHFLFFFLSFLCLSIEH